MILKFSLKLIVIVVIFALALAVCFMLYNKNSFENELVKKINSLCVTTTSACILKIADLTPYSWDKMYIFNEGFEKNEVEKILGIKLSTNSFSKRKIILVKENKILLYDELPTNPEHNVESQIFFDGLSGKGYKVYTPETAVFLVSKTNVGYGVYFDLRRVKE